MTECPGARAVPHFGMTDRREFLLGALAAPLLSTIPQGRHALATRPRDRDFIIEASCGLIFRNGAGVVVPDVVQGTIDAPIAGRVMEDRVPFDAAAPSGRELGRYVRDRDIDPMVLGGNGPVIEFALATP